MEKSTNPSFTLLERSSEDSEIVYQTETVSQVGTMVSSSDNVQTMYALTPATIQDDNGGLRQVYVTLDNPEALGSLAEQLGEMNSSQLVTLTMQVPPQVPSQLNLPGGQILLQQQDSIGDAQLSGQVSVAYVSPESTEDAHVVEKPLPAALEKVFSSVRATLSEAILEQLSTSKELIIQELTRDFSLFIEDEDSLVSLVGDLKELLRAEYKLLNCLPLESQDIIKTNYQDASCQTDPVVTESRSVDCSILRPQYSRSGREVKKKYYDLPEDYSVFDVKTSSDRPKSRLIKKTNIKSKQKISAKIAVQNKLKSPSKEEVEISDSVVNEIDASGDSQKVTLVTEPLEDEFIAQTVQETAEPEEGVTKDDLANNFDNGETSVSEMDMTQVTVTGETDMGQVTVTGAADMGQVTVTGEEDMGQVTVTGEEDMGQVTVTGEVVEDELQRAMVEGFLTMYTMKSNGEMLVPVGERDEDLLQDSANAEAIEEDIPTPPKKKKDYEKLAPFKYFCQKCSFKTKRESHFLKHVRLHAKHPVYRCDKCDFATLTFTHLRKHEVVHSNKLFQCIQCPYTTVSNKLLARHHRNKHSEKAVTNKKMPNKVYQCSHCDYKTTVQLRYTRHFRRHSYVNETGNEGLTAVYKCDQCNYKTCRKEHFRRHVDNVHSNKRPHLCDFCGKSFNRTDNLQTHKQIHMDKSHRAYPYYCNICDRTFRTKGHLKEHAVKHSTERQYLCEICGASFKTRAVQRKHVQTIHLNAGAFSCPQCQKVFSTKHAMKRHMKTHDTPGMRALQGGMTEVLPANTQVIQDLGDFAGQTVTVIQTSAAGRIEASGKIEAFEQSETFEQVTEGATSYVTQSADGTTTLLYLAPIQ